MLECFKMLSSYAKAVSIVFHLLQLFAISSSASGGDLIPLLPNFRTLLLFLQLSNMMALIMISQVTLLVKSLLANAGDERDASSTPGSGRFPGGGNGNPLQYSSLEKSYRQRRLMGYSPWGCIELDMTFTSLFSVLHGNLHVYFSSQNAHLWGQRLDYSSCVSGSSSYSSLNK